MCKLNQMFHLIWFDQGIVKTKQLSFNNLLLYVWFLLWQFCICPSLSLTLVDCVSMYKHIIILFTSW